MVHVPRLTPAQSRLRVDAEDQPDFRLRSVLAGKASLERGDEGGGVRLVQDLLNRFGSKLEADGIFGPLTEGAVERFQRGHELRATGQVDEATLRKLLTKNPRTPIKQDPLELGDKGKRVEAMEKNLAKLGYLDRAEIGGTYDDATAKAVRAFRRDQPELSDKVRGEHAGSPTQLSLAREVRALQHAPERGRQRRTDDRVAANQRTAVAARGETPIGEGDTRRGVVGNIQRHLKAAGYDPKRTDGTFDERTGAALEAFQKHSGLPATGTVDAATWKALRGSIVLANDGTSPPQARGERSAAVLKSEKLLEKAGFHPGRVDGKFDGDTLRALHRFEREHPRAGDGDVIGARQLDALKKAAKNQFVKPVDAKLTPNSEFSLPDPEGAPANNGQHYHAAKDWFAPGGTPVRAPVDGKIVEVRPSLNHSGQVFGGTVKIQAKDGKVWVFRHVDPSNVHVGQQVQAGKQVARVTNWTSGPDHTHVELWKSLSGGYDYENMIDPMKYLKKFL